MVRREFDSPFKGDNRKFGLAEHPSVQRDLPPGVGIVGFEFGGRDGRHERFRVATAPALINRLVYQLCNGQRHPLSPQ
jgi:hypothetical protein